MRATNFVMDVESLDVTEWGLDKEYEFEFTDERTGLMVSGEMIIINEPQSPNKPDLILRDKNREVYGMLIWPDTKLLTSGEVTLKEAIL